MKSIRVAIAMASVCLAVGQGANAQIDEHRFEVGAALTTITLTDFQGRTLPGFSPVDKAVTGISGRLAYNVTEQVAIDAEGNFFPETHLFNDEFGQKTQAFIGVKAGWRTQRVGAFAKARAWCHVVWRVLIHRFVYQHEFRLSVRRLSRERFCPGS
jgi:hypothetical protein